MEERQKETEKRNYLNGGKLFEGRNEAEGHNEVTKKEIKS
jgi:hypothetical protein